jgi:hypothetical protein
LPSWLPSAAVQLRQSALRVAEVAQVTHFAVPSPAAAFGKKPSEHREQVLSFVQVLQRVELSVVLALQSLHSLSVASFQYPAVVLQSEQSTELVLATPSVQVSHPA